MKYTMNGKHTSISDTMMEKAKKKVGKFEKFFRPESEAFLTFNVEKDRYTFEATIQSKGIYVRAEETSDDMYSSIDLVIDKLERQIRKYKTKLGKRIHQEQMVPDNFDIAEDIEEEEFHPILKTKRFTLKPMDPDEAILQMNLLGHNFFVFTNGETEQVNVVYKRNNGSYGLIEPEY